MVFRLQTAWRARWSWLGDIYLSLQTTNSGTEEIILAANDRELGVILRTAGLLHLFNKTLSLSDDQKKTVVDLLSTFLLKANLTKQLA